jgi:Fur family ferric uptake transcriptional regulator
MGVIRRTKSVISLLELFEQTNEALSATDLVERLNYKMNKTTVYRILVRLEDEGVLHAFKGRDGLQWYAMCKGCTASHHADLHPHFQCKQCGKTECLDVELSLPSVLNHKIDSAEVLLIGHCEDCMS